MLESRFNKVADLKVSSFIKKRLQHSCFPLNVRKLLGTAFFYRTPPATASNCIPRDFKLK